MDKNEYGTREAHLILGISALTSWIAPCTVWINRKLQGKRGHVITSTFVTVLTNLIALGCLSILAKHFTFNKVRSPPVIHCFNNSNGFANVSYHFIQNASLWNAITLSTDSEVPKIRICSDGEEPTTVLHNLLPVVACLCGVTLLTSFALFYKWPQWFTKMLFGLFAYQNWGLAKLFGTDLDKSAFIHILWWFFFYVNTYHATTIIGTSTINC